MSLQTLIAMSTRSWDLAETLMRVNAALCSCESVLGLYSVERMVGPSLIKMCEEDVLRCEDNGYLGESDLMSVKDEILRCKQGLEAVWEVSRYRRNADARDEIETWSHSLSLSFLPSPYRYSNLMGISDELFFDGGTQRYFLPTRMHDKIASEAAAFNLELLVEEMSAVAAIPVCRLVGLPIHTMESDTASDLNAAWMYFKPEMRCRVSDSIGVHRTPHGELYYSLEGPLGDLALLQLDGSIT